METPGTSICLRICVLVPFDFKGNLSLLEVWFSRCASQWMTRPQARRTWWTCDVQGQSWARSPAQGTPKDCHGRWIVGLFLPAHLRPPARPPVRSPTTHTNANASANSNINTREVQTQPRDTDTQTHRHPVTQRHTHTDRHTHTHTQREHTHTHRDNTHTERDHTRTHPHTLVGYLNMRTKDKCRNTENGPTGRPGGFHRSYIQMSHPVARRGSSYQKRGWMFWDVPWVYAK